LDKIKYSTPTVNDAKDSSFSPSQINQGGLVGDVMRNWPTPTCRDWKSGTGAQERPGHALPLSSAIGGQLNPLWVEWLIGWPIGWTDLKPLGMDKFRSWQQQHSGF